MSLPFNITNPGWNITSLLTSQEAGFVTYLYAAGASASENEVLTWKSGAPSWEVSAAGFADPLTTNGDIIARISGVTTRLAKGSNGTYLGVSGGVLGYYSPSGSGDVVGPASAVDSNFAAFNTTTGKLIKDSGSKASDFATVGHNHTGIYAPVLGADDNYVTDIEKAALHGHLNKIILDNTTASFLTTQETKLGYISVTQAVNLDTMESDIVTNNAKVTNATHTGEVTGSGALTIDKIAITGKTAVTAVGTDYVLISDTSDSGNLKKALVSDFGGGGSGNVTKVGTPVDNQIGVWTGDGTIEGDLALTFDTSTNTLTFGEENSFAFINAKTATTSNTVGGSIEINGGNGLGTGDGGTVIVNGGTAGLTGDGGTLSLYGGDGGATSGLGGYVDIAGGISSLGDGGLVHISGGNSVGGNGNGGNVIINTGNKNGTGTNGNVLILNSGTGSIGVNTPTPTQMMEITVDDTDNKIGLAISQMDATNDKLALEVNGKIANGTVAKVTPQTLVQFNDTNGSNSDLSINVASSSSPAINLQATGGTLNSPTALSSGYVISTINSFFYNSANVQKRGSVIESYLYNNTSGSEDVFIYFKTIKAGVQNYRLFLNNTALLPYTSGELALGSGILPFSNLYLTSGGAINWNNGNATLTHSTGLITSNVPISLGTSNALTAGTIELGATSDTTISRSSSGVIAVEGIVVPTISSTDTLTNKRITKRIGSTTSSATPTVNTDNVDIYKLTAQTVDITSFTTNLSGTPTDGQTLIIQITGTAARAITWGASFEASTVALPTTTVSTNRLDVGFIWNTATSKWRCIASA